MEVYLQKVSGILQFKVKAIELKDHKLLPKVMRVLLQMQHGMERIIQLRLHFPLKIGLIEFLYHQLKFNN